MKSLNNHHPPTHTHNTALNLHWTFTQNMIRNCSLLFLAQFFTLLLIEFCAQKMRNKTKCTACLDCLWCVVEETSVIMRGLRFQERLMHVNPFLAALLCTFFAGWLTLPCSETRMYTDWIYTHAEHCRNCVQSPCTDILYLNYLVLYVYIK